MIKKKYSRIFPSKLIELHSIPLHSRASTVWKNIVNIQSENNILQGDNGQFTVAAATRMLISLPDDCPPFWARFSLCVKGIGRVSPMKLKVTGKSDSRKRRWIPISERVSNKPGYIVVNAKPLSQYNLVTGQVVNESNKAQQPQVESAVDQKDNPKVKPVVVKEKPAVVKEKPAGVTSKVSKGKDDVVKAPVVADKDDVVKAPVVVDKAPVVKAMVVKATIVDNVVADKEPVKEKLAGNVGKAPVKDKVKVSVLKGSLALVKDNVKAPVKDKV
ncbi:hypothetical protein Tco_0009656, partial [Tanacetum coccineum]